MAKHLAAAEKKKTAPKTRDRSIRIPELGSRLKNPARPGKKKRESALSGVMLTKTLDKGFNPYDFLITCLSLVLLIVAYFLPTSGLVRLLSFLVPFLLAGYDTLYEAFQEAFMGIVLGRELIITVACLMAFCGGAYFGAAAIVIFLKIADLALAWVEERQREKVSALYALRPETAKLADGDAVVVVLLLIA